MPAAVEGLQQERRALSPERDLALPFSRGGELRGRSRIRDDCLRPLTVAQSRLCLVRCLLKCGLRRTYYHNPCMAMVRGRAGATRGAGRVANGRTYPYLRGDLGQAARGGMGGGGRLGGSEGRLSGGAEACLASLASPRGR